MNKKPLYILAPLIILAGCSQQPATTISTTTTTSTPATTSSTPADMNITLPTDASTAATLHANDVTNSTTTTTPDSSTTPATPTSSTAPTTPITISSFSFSPASLSVKQGTTVTWTNQDSVAHNIMADLVTEDTPNFGSASLSQGDTYSYTFNTPGTFNYHCGIHPNMKGSVTVTP